MKTSVLFFLLLAGCTRAPIVVLNEAPRVPAPQLIGGGSDVGSGGDNQAPDHLAAWFIGKERVIKACVETSTDFGVSSTVAHDTILTAFTQWKYYIEGHGVWATEPVAKQLSTSVDLKDGCDGSADISFFLGVENETVRAAKGQFNNPTAFIQRTSFDPAVALEKGFVWVSRHGGVKSGFPDWKQDGRLLTILEHELGHVYGNDHVPGTVMAENISGLFATEWAGEALAEIDHCRELAPCIDCDYGIQLDPRSVDNEKTSFLRKILGAKAEGPLTLKLSRTGMYGSFLGLGMQEESNLTTHSNYLLANRNTHPAFSTELATFKRFIEGRVTSGSDVSSIQYSTVIQNKNGALDSVGMIIIEYNLATCGSYWSEGRYPVEVSYVEDDEQKPLGSFADVWRRTPGMVPIYPIFIDQPSELKTEGK